MSLTIELPSRMLDDDHAVPATYTFLPLCQNHATVSDLVVRDTTLIAWGKFVEVYRGVLSLGPNERSIPVVCKVGEDAIKKRLKNEQRLYDGKLKHLQGSWIPKFYGCFYGEVNGDDRTLLILEDCGEMVTECFAKMELSFKVDLIEAFRDIHRAGVAHCDVAERNILVKNGRPVVIDFGEAEEEECQCTMDMVPGDYRPHEADFDCDELYELGMSLDIWQPSTICYMGTFYPIKYASDARKLARKAPTYFSYPDALREAYQAILKHAKAYYPDRYEEMRVANELYLEANIAQAMNTGH
ncbi:hypothetical protein BV25DRAFT_1912671 [Artomyces pyxidatus]|uniref:Uncharacterized protein n=1 Tax=Artomyces pyxidatus TaxID=48021 RepID=A0ACB8TDW0_9AGAM|nr:hypothetical protein BV25DRAFT_1912671 [Artomyces pyxidatus]